MPACDLNTGCEEERYHPYLCPTIIHNAHHFSIPFPKDNWNEIAHGLWQGDSRRQPYREEFDAVVTLYHRAPHVEAGVHHKEWLIPDAGMPALWQLDETVAWALFRWMQGDRVLIRCQAGLNRSGLVTARVLLDSGASIQETIHLIRSRRSPYALCNRNFEEYLRELDK